MRIVYHATGSALTPAALRAWLASTLALSGAAFSALTTPSMLISITDPDYPFAFEDHQRADDRETPGGIGWSRLYGGQRRGEWAFSRVHTVELPAWRAWYAATSGFRLPFIVEIGSDRYAAIAPGLFPLSLSSYERWDGALSVREALAWI